MRWWREKTGRQRGAVECCAETADNTDIDVDISTQNIEKRPLLVERVYTCLSIEESIKTLIINKQTFKHGLSTDVGTLSQL